MSIKFYAACLASYNNGVLHGAWIDADSDVETMQESVNAMLRDSKYPNVVVNCPDCDNCPTERETCKTCKGTGGVPSAEEWAIHDFDGLPSNFGEYCGLQKIADYVDFIDAVEEISTNDSESLARAMLEEFHSLEWAQEALVNFIGIYDSFKDYAESCADDMLACHSRDGKVPQELINYFDYESYARDLQYEYAIVELPHGVAIFCQL